MPTTTEWTAAAVPILAAHETAMQQRIAEVRQGIAFLRGKIREEKTKHDEINKTFEIGIRSLQKQCPHPRWRHYPDPSGNSDSFDECELCGKQQ
jgi:hypothetical protein